MRFALGIHHLNDQSHISKEPAPTGLVSWQDCEAFDAAAVRAIYEETVGKSHVRALMLLGMAKETVAEAQGNTIITDSGRRILDMSGGVGVLGLGHNHPRILAARMEFQRRHRMEVHKAFLSKYLAGLNHNIARLLPGDLGVSFMCNSGAEAVEGAVKLAYKFHGGRRGRILHADNSFHGKLLGSSGLTAFSEQPFKFPTIPGIDTFEYDKIESVEAKIAELRRDGESDIYAIVLEPYCANALRGCSAEFLFRLREICTRERIVLIFDEVYTGWGKTGSLFYFMRHEGIVPDILTMSKTLGGGKASISNFTARAPIYREAYDNMKDFTLHSTTYNGFGEECATAIEAINVVIEEGLPARAAAIEKRLGPALRELKAKHPSMVLDTRGCGAHHGVILNPGLPRAAVALLERTVGANAPVNFLAKALTSAAVSELFSTHDILTYFVPNREVPLMLSPSMITTDAELDRALDALDKTLALGKARLIARLARRLLQR